MPDRSVPAPELAEVARIWWDVDRAPQVCWDRGGLLFELVDPGDETRRLELLRLAEAVEDPRRVAEVLADGLAACDFPPTEDRASAARVAATLRAARIDVLQVQDDQP